MKILAKTPFGFVKYPQKLAKEMTDKATFEILRYLLTFSTSKHMRAFVRASAKRRGFGAIKPLPESMRHLNQGPHIYSFDMDLNDLPRDYFKTRSMDEIERLNNSKIHLCLDWSAFNKNRPAAERDMVPHGSMKDFQGFYSEKGGKSARGWAIFPNSVVLSPRAPISSIFQLENYMRSLDVVETELTPQQKKDLRYYFNTYSIRLEQVLTRMEEMIQHELRHMVQLKLLPESQRKMLENYFDAEKDYYLSPVEFGPATNSSMASFTVSLKNDLKLYKMKGTIYTLHEVNLMCDMFLGIEIDNQYEQAFKRFIEPDAGIALLKKRKPTAYKKAVAYFNKHYRTAIIEFAEALYRQKSLRKMMFK